MFLFIFMAVALTILLSWGIVILTFVASWKVHAKATLPGWTGIIPFYNYYTRAQIANYVDIFWNILKYFGISMGTSIVGGLLLLMSSLISAASESTAGLIISIILGLIVYLAVFIFAMAAVVQIIRIDIRFVANFGKGKWFAVGMFFLPYIFLPILAWDKNIVWTGPVYEQHNKVFDVN